MMGYHGYKLVIARVVCYKLKLNFVILVVTALCPHFFFFFLPWGTQRLHVATVLSWMSQLLDYEKQSLLK